MTEEAPLRLVHALPGRLRIRVEGTDLSGLYRWEQRLRDLPGVTSVRANPAARSLLVEYQPDADLPGRLPLQESPPGPQPAAIQAAPGSSLATAPPTPTAQAVARAFWKADQVISARSDGKVDLKIAVPAVLLGAGLWELFTGVEVAAATFHTLAWYSYNIFIQLHPSLTAAAPDAPPTP